MRGDLRFTSVTDYDDGYEVTRNFASEINAAKSLYEVTTLSKISPEYDEGPFDTQKIPVLSCANRRLLAVVVNNDLCIFNVGMKTTKRLTVAIDAGTCVVGMEWLPNIDILVTVLDNKSLLFVNPAGTGPNDTSSCCPLDDLEDLERPLQSCKVVATVHASVCVVVLSEVTGAIFVVHLPGYSDVIDAKRSDQFLPKLDASDNEISGLSDYENDKPLIHVGLPQCFGLLFPTAPCEPLRIGTTSASWEELTFDELEDAEETSAHIGCRTVRRYGFCLLVLMNNNELAVYEDSTMMQLVRLDIGYSDDDSETIVDFHFADLADDLSNLHITFIYSYQLH